MPNQTISNWHHVFRWIIIFNSILTSINSTLLHLTISLKTGCPFLALTTEHFTFQLVEFFMDFKQRLSSTSGEHLYRQVACKKTMWSITICTWNENTGMKIKLKLTNNCTLYTASPSDIYVSISCCISGSAERRIKFHLRCCEIVLSTSQDKE